MPMIYVSRFMPNLPDGRNIDFKRGETVLYRQRNGIEVKIKIDSKIMTHAQAPGDGTGYECIFSDTGERAFAVRQEIINWKGKV